MIKCRGNLVGNLSIKWKWLNRGFREEKELEIENLVKMNSNLIIVQRWVFKYMESKV